MQTRHLRNPNSRYRSYGINLCKYEKTIAHHLVDAPLPLHPIIFTPEPLPPAKLYHFVSRLSPFDEAIDSGTMTTYKSIVKAMTQDHAQKLEHGDNYDSVALPGILKNELGIEPRETKGVILEGIN